VCTSLAFCIGAYKTKKHINMVSQTRHQIRFVAEQRQPYNCLGAAVMACCWKLKEGAVVWFGMVIIFLAAIFK
jgi:hypothetical protein